jgi:hypothetical protein
MRLRPHHIFLAILPLSFCLFYFHFSQEAQRAQVRIQNDKHIVGKVIKVKYGGKGAWSADVVIPPTFGITDCNVSVSKKEAKSLNGTIDLLVGKLMNGQYICWSLASVKETASGTMIEHINYGIVFGALLTTMTHFIVIRIPYGSPMRSLKKRWAEKT